MDEPQWCPQTEYTKTINDDLVAVSFHCPSYPAFLMLKLRTGHQFQFQQKLLYSVLEAFIEALED